MRLPIEERDQEWGSRDENGNKTSLYIFSLTLPFRIRVIFHILKKKMSKINQNVDGAQREFK